MQVVVARRAQREILAASAWWRENREAAPLLFEMELRRAFKLLEAAPYAGRRAVGARVKDARVIILQRTRYLVFYRVVGDEVVRVLSVNHGRREGNPPVQRYLSRLKTKTQAPNTVLALGSVQRHVFVSELRVFQVADRRAPLADAETILARLAGP